MSDLTWPEGVEPFRASFYLQPHVGGAESPFTRTRKTYLLSKPRWLCTVAIRGIHDGEAGIPAFSPIMDSFIVQMDGGANRVALWDFRRPYPVGLSNYYSQFEGQRFSFTLGETFDLGEQFYVGDNSEPSNEFADAGATEITFTGFLPDERVFNRGDYFGGDGRVHIIHNDATADGDGRATVTFSPPLETALSAGDATTYRPTAMFRLSNPDGAGENFTDIDAPVVHTLEFIEDLP